MPAGHVTSNTRAFIEAQQYSKFILANLKDGLLPEIFYRDVSDFRTGEVLNIKTVGAASIQEVAEDEAIVYNPIDTGNVTLQITDFVGDGWYISDVLRQDGSQIEQLHAMRGMESTRAIQEHFESRFLAVAHAAQTAADPNAVNGFAHRIAGSGSNNIMTENDLIAMKLAFDKANVPQAGRVLIVDPVVEATLNKQVTLTKGLDRMPVYQGAWTDGFAREHKFITNIYGWDIWTCNRLPEIAASTDIDGTVTVAQASVANIAMCVLDDNTKPVMAAWRQQPTTEGERNKDRGRDEYVTRARWGLGPQRLDTLGVIVTSATHTA